MSVANTAEAGLAMGGETPASRPELYASATLGALLIGALQRAPERIAFESGAETVSYQQLYDRIARAVATLRALGLKRGDVVAQLSSNRPDVFALIAAAYIAGFRSCTLHAMGSLEDQAYILRDSGAKVLVVDPAHRPRGQSLQAELGAALETFCHEDGEGLASFWSLPAPDIAPLRAEGDAEDIIRLAYTGGTTGRPKGVMLSNRSLVTNTVCALVGAEWPEQVRFLCPTPISHGAGSMILPTFLRGGTVVLQDGFSVDRVLDALESDEISYAFFVPTMIYALLDSPRIRASKFPALHTILYGAAPMAPARVREALAVFGPVLCQAYGQTECPNAILTLSRADHLSGGDERLSSAGRPYPGVEVRLLDDDGAEVAPGEVGEVCVRGPLVMSGYWGLPDLTREAFKGDWLHTGDMARQDALGFFYLVDRKKDLIISGGFNVFPGEVEGVLTAHPGVSAACVIGVPDPKWGEAVKAVVVLKPGATTTAAELIGLVKDRKGYVSAPKTLDFVDAIPLTALGKPDKKALRARFWSGTERSIN